MERDEREKENLGKRGDRKSGWIGTTREYDGNYQSSVETQRTGIKTTRLRRVLGRPGDF